MLTYMIYMVLHVVYLKCIKTKDVFTKTEINNEWNINFLHNSPLGIQHSYSSEFSMVYETMIV